MKWKSKLLINLLNLERGEFGEAFVKPLAKNIWNI